MARKFIISNVFNMGIGDVLYFLATTGDKNIEFNPTSIEAETNPVLVELFEDPVISSAGATTIDGVDMNRQSNKTPVTVVHDAPVVTSDGTNIFKGTAVGTKSGGGTPQGTVLEKEHMFYLAKNTQYLYKVTNNSGVAADVTISFIWKEF